MVVVVGVSRSSGAHLVVAGDDDSGGEARRDLAREARPAKEGELPVCAELFVKDVLHKREGPRFDALRGANDGCVRTYMGFY